MKVKVTLFKAGTVWYQTVQAIDYEDAKRTVLAQNPSAKVLSVTAVF